ncbi:hypothetical protein ES708_12074 [subsurface metagenome]
MLSILKIITIARYETKILLRSWFFRIFSLLSMGILILLNIGLFATPYSPWSFRGIPSSIPYLNLLLLNVVQAIIGVFMASDFLKYDNKLDTTEVIYMRSMTNADYVLGKTIGILSVFAGLNILVLIIAFVFNVFFADVPFVASVYVLYPLLISLPTLLFIFGLTFLLMVIIRSQAVTFILLLGYIATTLFFLSNKFHYIFDYMAFNVPLQYSDFIGFGDMKEILMHRSIYLLLGIGFICLTILMLKRLPQSKFINRIALIIAMASISGSAILVKTYISGIYANQDLRARMTVLNKQAFEDPSISITNCELELIHSGDTIDCSAKLVFTNKTSEPIEQYTFSLNPGLEVTGVDYNGNNTDFKRNIHLLTIQAKETLQPGDTDSLAITYRGKINEEACYVEVDEGLREENFRNGFFAIDKRYGIIAPDYILLTPETLWYPVSGVPYGSAYPLLKAKDFINFTLRVKTADGLTAISQGSTENTSGGEYVFTPEVPLPRLSLAVGKYEKRSITVDEIDYHLYILEGHDYFSEFFTDVGEVLPEIISDTRIMYENSIGLEYPYRRFTLIETPIQFYSYPRMWTLSQESVQPEQILLPEKGVTLSSSDFKRTVYIRNRHGGRGGGDRGGGGNVSAEEVQRMILNGFIRSTFAENRERPDFRAMRGGGFARNLMVFTMSAQSVNFSSLSHYLSDVYNFSSDKWPMFNVATEFYFSGKTKEEMPSFISSIFGLSAKENANLALDDRNFSDILTEPDDNVNIYDVLENKCEYLYAYLQSELGSETFEDFLMEFLDANRFGNIKVEDFVDELKNRYGFDLAPQFDDWMNETELPAFIMSDPFCEEILMDELTQYQVTFSITNPESVEGLVTASFRAGGGGPGGMRGGGGGGMMMMFGGAGSSSDEEYNIKINAGETKEIGIILDDPPRQMTVNTHISKNLPSIIERDFRNIELNENAVPFEGERILDQMVGRGEPGEIIVDNEDAGFEINTVSSDSYIKRMLTRNKLDDEEYIGMTFWNMPRRWSATTGSGFFGLFRYSAHYIRAGKGDNSVSWSTEIPKSGRYNIYFYIPEMEQVHMVGGRGRGRGDNRGRRQSAANDFHVKVYHDDGVDEITLEMGGASSGWLPLGTFFLSEGTAKIELTDQTKGQLVYADAVKWIEQ